MARTKQSARKGLEKTPEELEAARVARKAAKAAKKANKSHKRKQRDEQPAADDDDAEDDAHSAGESRAAKRAKRDAGDDEAADHFVDDAPSSSVLDSLTINHTGNLFDLLTGGADLTSGVHRAICGVSRIGAGLPRFPGDPRFSFGLVGYRSGLPRVTEGFQHARAEKLRPC